MQTLCKRCPKTMELGLLMLACPGQCDEGATSPPTPQPSWVCSAYLVDEPMVGLSHQQEEVAPFWLSCSVGWGTNLILYFDAQTQTPHPCFVIPIPIS